MFFKIKLDKDVEEKYDCLMQIVNDEDKQLLEDAFSKTIMTGLSFLHVVCNALEEKYNGEEVI